MTSSPTDRGREKENEHLFARPTLVVGDWIQKIGGDYNFDGQVRAVFQKRSGKWRVVAENHNGILHIFNAEQLRKV